MLPFTRSVPLIGVLVVTTNTLSDLKRSVVLRELMKSGRSLIQRNVRELNIEFESIVYILITNYLRCHS